MDIPLTSPLDPPHASSSPRPAQSREAGERELFSAALARVGNARTPHEHARQAAEDLIGAALVKPVLKGLRESNGAAAPFAPGAGEKAFRGMMDDMLAQRLVKSGDWALVSSLTNRLLERAGGAKS